MGYVQRIMLFLSRRGGAGGGQEAPSLQPLTSILELFSQHLLYQVYYIAAGTTSEAVKMIVIEVAGGCPLSMERTAHFMLNYMKAKTFCGVAQVVDFFYFIDVEVVHT